MNIQDIYHAMLLFSGFVFLFSVFGRVFFFFKLLFHSPPSPCLHPDKLTLISLFGVKKRQRAGKEQMELRRIKGWHKGVLDCRHCGIGVEERKSR